MPSNPFIPQPAEAPPQEVDVADDLFGDRITMSGPETPEAINATTPATEPWPRQEVTDWAPVVVMGLHGGAGTSTVASFFGDQATDVGLGWPIAGGWTRPRPELNVVAVCRNHRAGIEAGMEFAKQWASGSLQDSRLLGIVIVDDGPKLLEAQKKATKRLGQMTPHGWHVPWIEEWRISPPDTQRLPRRIKQTVKKILSLTEIKEKK
ncbi:DUF6668 family protein [Brevibacterium oceani]|uniref:DUF6668 family protein n=1 Tax=Brevibacterium oceani TaxID=358099 RepID=UPI0015E67FC4|nr:DUF6668 family protein [Brevibacterium oceani]